MILPRTTRNLRRSHGISLMIAICIGQYCGAIVQLQAQEQETPRAKAAAPPDQAIVGAKLGGSFFAPKPLKEYYDRLVSKVRSLEMEISEGRISGEQASRAVNLLRIELADVRKQIEEQKTFVAVAKMHLESDTTTFDLGPERRLLIMASKVRIVGWDKPQVKCVLDTTVLTAGDEPVDEHFEQMQVVHAHRRAEEEIGKTAEELDAEEMAYLASDEGKKLDQPAREWRRQSLEERKRWQGMYRPVQGRTIDVVSVKGLSHQEGNRQISLEVSSKNGEGSMSSHWQRHATLTVYVPACEAIVVQGGLGGLDIESVESALIVRGDGNQDYHGLFRVMGLKGPLTVDRVPLQTIDGVSGDVNVTMTTYLGNSGTRHADDTRTSRVSPPEQYSYKNIEGDFRGWFVRADLELANLGGTIDVVNEYGETKLTVEKPLRSAAHRLITHGGQIMLQVSDRALGDLPVLAVSECGTVRMGFDDRSFENVSWTSNMFHSELRGWRGFERKAPEAERESFFERFERVSKVLRGEDRTAGVDLVTRGGLIEITRAK